MESIISEVSFKRIYKYLQKISPIFSEMWRVQGRMVLTDDDEVDTAILMITKGNFGIKFNQGLWKRSTIYSRVYVICHEYTHVLLGHWIDPGINDEWLNVAQDIQVNEYLKKHFSFYPTSNDAATVDVVFREKAHKVKKDGDYRYYYDLIQKCLKKSK